MKLETHSHHEEPRFLRHPAEEVGNGVAFASADATSDMILFGQPSPQAEKHLGGVLKRARLELGALSSARKREFYETIMSEESSPFIRRIVGEACQEVDDIATERQKDLYKFSPANRVIEALTHKKANSRYIMPNRSFLNVMEHYAANRPNEEEYDTPTVVGYKEQYEEKVVQLVAKGVFPPSAIGNLMETQIVTVGAAEELHLNDGTPVSGMHGREGIRIRDNHVGGAAEANIMTHELTHALRYNVDEFFRHSSYDINPELYRIFDEGTTELITELIMGTDYDNKQFNAYVSERNLIIALCETSGGKLNAEDFIEVFFAGSGDCKNVAWLLDTISDTYSPQLLGRLKASKGGGKNAMGLNRLQVIITDLYLDWSKQSGLSAEQATVVADRLYDASSGTLVRKRFLHEETANQRVAV